MRNKKILLVLFFLFLFTANISYTQIKNFDKIDFYEAFGPNSNLHFLKNIGVNIQKAYNTSNPKALAAYSIMFFYAENITNKKLKIIQGLDLLKIATRIALKEKDYKTLNWLVYLWEEKYFGADKKELAKKLSKILSKPKLILTPKFKQVSTGSILEFILKKKIGDSESEVAEIEVEFKAKHGTFWKNKYFAPRYPCMDSIKAVYKTTGETKTAIIIIKDLKKIYLELKPKFPKVNINSSIDFTVFKVKGNLKEPVNLNKLTFSAKYGTFWENKYYSPSFSCKDHIEVVYKVTGEKLSTKVNVKSKKRKYKHLKNDIIRHKSNPVNAEKYHASNPDMAQKTLMKSEEARINSIDKLINRINRYLNSIPEDFYFSGQILNLLERKSWVGVETGEAYIYMEEPYLIHVKASITRKWIIESLKRILSRNEMKLSDSQLKELRKYFPDKIEAESSVNLKY